MCTYTSPYEIQTLSLSSLLYVCINVVSAAFIPLSVPCSTVLVITEVHVATICIVTRTARIITLFIKGCPRSVINTAFRGPPSFHVKGRRFAAWPAAKFRQEHYYILGILPVLDAPCLFARSTLRRRIKLVARLL